jgi:hypothetical protein
MKQRWIVLLALVVGIGFLTGCLTGCSGRSKPKEVLSAAGLAERLEHAGSLSGMKQGDAEKLRKLYHIEASDVADFVLYTALSNVKADELAVIQVKNAGDAEGVMDQIRQRVETQSVKFKDYRPEEYYLLEKHVLKSNGPFIFFAVSKFDDAWK